MDNYGDTVSVKTENKDSFIRKVWDNSGMILVFVIMFILLSIFVPYFLTYRNMIGLSLSVTSLGMVGSTMLFALAAGDLDLSVGSTVAFTGVFTAVVINATGSVFLGIVSGLTAGAMVGLVNGLIISRLKLNPLITTLATMQIVRGLGFIVSRGSAIGVRNADFFGLGVGSFMGIPNPVWITLACFIVFGVLLNNTSYGKNTLAIGGNMEAARLAGINVERTKTVIFLLQGIITALAGIVLASRMTSGQPNSANGFELDVISACVLGGVSLSGGVGSISGIIVGVLIMGTVQNAMNLLNIPTFYQYVVRGSILLIAVFLDQMKQNTRRN
ncbi:MAG: L-arabinose ABC transporter permease AraH [Spirochaetia bacterium]|nr:L-arabinose ABC transporter permease AraH [Spirochaetia bacterium]